MQSIKKAVKVSYQGETKRLKLSGVYQELVDRTRSAFKNLPHQIKFFYLDEDNEIISISSQSDYTEALEIEDFSSLRLTVAQTASDARSQLLVQLEEARPLAESLNQSQIMSQNHEMFGRSQSLHHDQFMAGSEFDAVSHAELGQSLRRNTMMESSAQHEIACGDDAPLQHSVSTGTDAKPSAVRAEAGCNTARVMTSEKMIDTCVSTAEMSSQARTHVKDMACDSMITHMQNQETQMKTEVKDMDVTCDLLIPSDDDGDNVDLEEVACFKCNGTQMNKKGLPCRKCNGRGTLVSKELSAVASMVRQEVQDYCYSTFKQMFTDYLSDKKADQDSTIHDTIVCDGCEVTPVKGIRYICSVCADTDFCHECVRSGVHAQHPLLKVRKPAQAPHKLICQYPNPMSGMPSARSTQASDPSDHPWERQAAPAKQVRYSARFVKESFPDKHSVNVGEIFCKSWWMRNDGETAWPAGTQFLQTSGDDISAKVVTLKNAVDAGQTFEISVMCKAPAQEGRYVAFFRMQTGRIKFGHKVSCDILCVKPAQPVEHQDFESDLMKPTAQAPQVQMVSQDPMVLEANDKEMLDTGIVFGQASAASATSMPEKVMVVDESAAAAEEPSDLLKISSITINAKSPKELYYEQANTETDPKIKSGLIDLYEFGFTNFAVNKQLIMKHNDVNIVANVLMSGALSESQFGVLLNQ